MPELLPDHIMCAKCAQIKVRAEFKRRLTPKEMRRYGKSGESGTVMTVLSKYCKDCQAKRRRWESLGLADLERIKKEGAEFHRISEYRLEQLIERARLKNEKANAERSRKLRKQHAEALFSLKVSELQAIIRKLSSRAGNKKNGEAKRHYLSMLESYAYRTRNFLMMAIEMGDVDEWKGFEPSAFTDKLTEGERQHLNSLYLAIPEDERQRMRKSF